MESLFLINEVYEVRALIAAILVGVTCGILGCFIVLRNMALIGDALSHAVLPGVVMGYVLAGYSVLAFFTGAVFAGFITAILITWLQRNVRTKEDSAIGIIFTVMFAIGIMGISLVNRKGVHLDMEDFLFGSILGVSDQDIWLTGLITLFVIVCIIVFYRYFFISTFQPSIARTLGISSRTMHYFLMLLLSFAIVASIQSVGVILVVAMLIIPASTAYLLANRLHKMVIISAFVGLMSTTLGLLAAILLNTTPGPAMTIMAAIIYFLTLLFAPERGLIVRQFRIRERKLRILREDLLKRIAYLHELKDLSLNRLKEELSVGSGKLSMLLNQLVKLELIRMKDDIPNLTQKGQKMAYELIRAHRLWETYLSKDLGLSADQIHEEAEKYEHLLPESFLDELDRKLGFPSTDPHGSVIPQKQGDQSESLSSLELNQKAIIVSNQENEKVSLELWQLGLTPNKAFEVTGKDEEFMELILDDQTLKLKRSLADEVKITPIHSSF